MGCLLCAEDRQHCDMESGIRKRNHGNGNRNGNGIRKERFQAISLKNIYISNDNKINNHQYSISIQLGEKVERIAKTPELWSRHGSVMC